MGNPTETTTRAVDAVTHLPPTELQLQEWEKEDVEGIGKGLEENEKPQQGAQGGVQKVEAVTLLWTRRQLLWAYFL